jgi:hypothetical protein
VRALYSFVVLITSLFFISGCGFSLSVNDEESLNDPPADDLIEKAVATGNPAYLPAEASKLELRIQTLIKNESESTQSLLQEIFSGNSVVFNPGRSSRFFYPNDLASVKEIVVGNKGHVFVTAYNHKGYRAVAIGDDVLDEMPRGEHAEFQQPMKKLIDWLLAPFNSASEDTIERKFALMLMSNSEMTNAENWLKANYIASTVVRCTDEITLTSCINAMDVVITGSDPDIAVNKVVEAMHMAATNNKSFLYLHNRSWNSSELTNPILRYFGVSTQAPGGAGNYFSQDAADWDSSTAMFSQTNTLSGIQSLVERLEKKTFSFNISDCKESDGSCSDAPAFKTEFLLITQRLKQLINAFDNKSLDIFNEEYYLLENHLILLGDKYRETVSFPLSRDSSDTYDYLKSFFADHLVYYSREFNPTQGDLGNFSRTDFSHITLLGKTVNVVSRERFRAAGVYALPGQTFRVERTDDLMEVDATIFINTQRDSSVHHMNNDKYNRPKFIQSPHISIDSGETIYVTSPYGGPIQVGFSDQGSALTFRFSQVGQHPFWRAGGDDTEFLNALFANHYDWAEIATEHFEIHSKTEKMLKTLEGSLWDTPTKIEYFITKYHHNYHKILSGYRGENIGVIEEIHNFAQAKGFEIPEYKQVQHMNADQATCGYGCSGNPYDAFWEFQILGHGDLHEVGHNFESGRFRFNGSDGHAVTNFYSYYVKSRAYKDEGVAHNCQNLPFNSIMNDINTSQDEADPGAYMASLAYSGWSQSAALVIQLMMHAETEGKLNNGWHMIPRLHLLEFSFEAADNSEADWDLAKNKLGFTSYSRDEALAIDRNDWLLISSSFVTDLEFRPFFDLVGQVYSDKASDQVASYNYPKVPKGFYLPSSNNAYCDRLQGHTLSTF